MMEATASAELRRFLLTGCDSGVYRTAGYQPVPERAQTFLRALAAAGPKTIQEITSHSHARPEAALFALALASSPRFAPPESVSFALSALPELIRRAQDLATFAALAANFRGWGRGLRSAVGNWYLEQDPNELAAQMLRRPGRNLAQHRALIRRAHPKSANAMQNALFQWIANGGSPGHLASPGLLGPVDGYLSLQAASTEAEAIRCIEDFRLQPPQVPKRWKSSPRVWEALFDHMGYRQLLRNLPAMTDSGLLTRGSEYTALAVARLADPRRIRAASVRPLRAIEALRRYRLQTETRPVESLFDALDEAFHLSLSQVEPLRQRIVVAVDATGSMQGAPTLGMREVPAALSAAAIALSFAHAAGRQAVPVAFHREARPLERCHTKARLAETLNDIRATPSRSDAASVIRYAAQNRVQADAFVVVTDRIDTTALFEEFRPYRETIHAGAKLALVALSGIDSACDEESTMVFSGMNGQHAWTALSAFLQPTPL